MSLGHKAETGAAALTSVGRSHRGESVVHAHARKCKPLLPQLTALLDKDKVNCTTFQGSFENPEFLGIKFKKSPKENLYQQQKSPDLKIEIEIAEKFGSIC